MYTIFVVFKCVPEKREEYIKKLKEEGIVEAIRNEDGCIQYDFYFSEKDKDEILLLEAWESKKHQEIHLSQPHMIQLRKIKDDYVVSTEIGEFKII